MKKVLTICFLAIFLSGCTGEDTLQNYIRPMELTDDQQHLMDLVSHGNEIYIFEFNTSEAFTAMEFWIDVYEYGIFSETAGGLHISGFLQPAHNGQFSVVISGDNRNAWSLANHGESGGGRMTTSTPTIPESNMGRLASAIQEPVPIELYKDIVLYVALFSQTGRFGMPRDKQQLFTDPEWEFETYSVAHVLKARFTR
ncbi:MAG: hypothetical protein FWB80_13550 [Defluviitaleaceae bacterium]|nr:hypothetical protein [Defluviitaleaceae bacterium]